MEPCAACRKPLLQGSIVTLNGSTYHAACFCCTICRSSLLDAGKAGGVHMNGGKPHCSKCWTENFAERCAGCRQPFTSRQQVVLFDGQKLHPQCFKCSGTCGKPIGSGKYMREGDKPYCATCHTAAFAPKCGVCRLPIEGGSRFIVHKGKKLHPSCFCCCECGTALGGSGNGAAGGGTAEHYERDGAIYCADDYRRNFGEECGICRERLLSWIVTEAGETYCQKHEKDSPPCRAYARASNHWESLATPRSAHLWMLTARCVAPHARCAHMPLLLTRGRRIVTRRHRRLRQARGAKQRRL